MLGKEPLPSIVPRCSEDASSSVEAGSSDASNSGAVSLPQAQIDRWLWLKLLIILGCSLGSLAGTAIFWLLSLPPATDCRKVSPLDPERVKLHCAEEAARTGQLPQLLTGMQMVASWSPGHPLYAEGQRLMAAWSQRLLELAYQRMEQRDWQGAVALARQIPKSSPLHPEAQATIDRWQQSWRRGQLLSAKAQKAMASQDWQGASSLIADLRQLPYDYWSIDQVRQLSAQLIAERRGRRLLAQAQQLARSGQTPDLMAAIGLVQSITAKTHTQRTAQADLHRWHNTLLTLGFRAWWVGNLEQAIALGRQVSTDRALAPEGQALIRLTQARQLAIASTSRWRATPGQVMNLAAALVLAEQIPATSRFYRPAQRLAKNWQAQLQVVVQLQVAQMVADLGHPAALQFAMAQAQAIGPRQPRRLQAQTLAASWREEIERIEDRPYLDYARYQAETGTLSALQWAIAQARRVMPDRALYSEARGLIWVWQKQIETLQDRPILHEAWALADQGQWQEAIQLARTIRPERELYPSAQEAITEWQAQLRQIRLAQQPAPRSDQARTNATPPESIQPPLLEPPSIATVPSEFAPAPSPPVGRSTIPSRPPSGLKSPAAIIQLAPRKRSSQNPATSQPLGNAPPVAPVSPPAVTGTGTPPVTAPGNYVVPVIREPLDPPL